MKYILLFVILGVFILRANPIHALSYKDTPPTGKIYENISSQSISESLLLKSYVEKYKNQIRDRYNKLGYNDSEKLEDAFTILNIMSNRLTLISEKKIEERYVEDMMREIIVDLKYLNTKIKEYFERVEEEIKTKIKAKQVRYSKISVSISKKLDLLVRDITNIFVKKDSLSQTDKEIVKILVQMRDESRKLQEFTNRNFDSEEDMKIYLRDILNNIKDLNNTLKKLSRS